MLIDKLTLHELLNFNHKCSSKAFHYCKHVMCTDFHYYILL